MAIYLGTLQSASCRHGGRRRVYFSLHHPHCLLLARQSSPTLPSCSTFTSLKSLDNLLSLTLATRYITPPSSMPSTTVCSFISLALLIPATFALSFDWSFAKGKAYEVATWPSDETYTHRPHWTYTMTATTDIIFPTAPATTSYAYATGTGTAPFEPTATAYSKRGLEERHHAPFSFPTAFSTAAFPFPTAATGTGFSYPTAYPVLPSSVNELEQEIEDLELSLLEKRTFGGPRRHFAGQWKPTWAPAWHHASSSSVVPTATGSAGVTGMAPSGTAPAA